MKSSVILLISITLSFAGLTQNQARVDSLYEVLEDAPGEQKAGLYVALAKEYSGQLDSIKRLAPLILSWAAKYDDVLNLALGTHYEGVILSQQGNSLSSTHKHRKAMQLFASIDRKDKVVRQLLNIGNRFAEVSVFDSSEYYYLECLNQAEKINDQRLVSAAYLNLSALHFTTGDKEKELKYMLKALNYAEKNEDRNQLAIIYGNMVGYFIRTKEFDKALEYGKLSEFINLELNNILRISNTYNNLASVYFNMKDLDSAQYYLDKAADIYRRTGNRYDLALNYQNQAALLGTAGRTEAAMILLDKAYDIWVDIGERRMQAKVLSAMSAQFEKQGSIRMAMDYLNQAIEIGREIGLRHEIIQWYNELAQFHTLQGNYRAAYETNLIYIQLKDSFAEETNQRHITEMEAKFQNEKQQLLIDKLKTEKIAKEQQIKRENTQKLAFAGGFALMLVLAFVAFRSYRQKKKDNTIISRQKQEVEHQKELLEETNKAITDSITYAQRIQQAILPPDRLVKEYLKESFILYKPKDIVAGDFYWIEAPPPQSPSPKGEGEVSLRQLAEDQGGLLFAAADCTGHGVPGAMVSVVCHNAMNRAVREFGLRSPAEILDKTNELVEETFEKSENEVKDGMDLALVSLPLTPSKGGGITVEYAGANNPLYIVRHAELVSASTGEWETLNPPAGGQGDGAVLFEIPPDKQPVGKYEHRQPFTNHRIELQKGDCIYIFSDGFADQFGGPKGKKFKYKPFRELLLANHNKPMEKQKQLLDEAIENWRGELEQVDDICVIGVRV